MIICMRSGNAKLSSVDDNTYGGYTREFSNLSSFGLKRSLVCCLLPPTLISYCRIELRNFRAQNVLSRSRTTDFGFVLLMS